MLPMNLLPLHKTIKGFNTSQNPNLKKKTKKKRRRKTKRRNKKSQRKKMNKIRIMFSRQAKMKKKNKSFQTHRIAFNGPQCNRKLISSTQKTQRRFLLT
jgi:hypothetical protein